METGWKFVWIMWKLSALKLFIRYNTHISSPSTPAPANDNVQLFTQFSNFTALESLKVSECIDQSVRFHVFNQYNTFLGNSVHWYLRASEPQRFMFQSGINLSITNVIDSLSFTH